MYYLSGAYVSLKYRNWKKFQLRKFPLLRNSNETGYIFCHYKNEINIFQYLSERDSYFGKKIQSVSLRFFFFLKFAFFFLGCEWFKLAFRKLETINLLVLRVTFLLIYCTFASYRKRIILVSEVRNYKVISLN